MRKIVVTVIGTALTAMAFGMFILPAGIACGGMTGLALVIAHLTSLPLHSVVLAVNVAFFLIGRIVLGRSFAMHTLLSVICFTPFLTLFSCLPIVLPDWMSALYGGILLGIGSAMILSAGASSGGFDVLGTIVWRMSGHSPTMIMYGLDAIIMCANAENLNKLLPGILVSITAWAVSTIILHVFSENRAYAGHALLNSRGI
jgi:uncharacterized membrane-anchored protein YitT (DUF2179 family)